MFNSWERTNNIMLENVKLCISKIHKEFLKEWEGACYTSEKQQRISDFKCSTTSTMFFKHIN